MTLLENLDVELVDGHHVLGSVLGYSSAWEKFKVEEATEFSTLLNKLASHGNKRPKMYTTIYQKGHSINSRFCHALRSISRMFLKIARRLFVRS